MPVGGSPPFFCKVDRSFGLNLISYPLRSLTPSSTLECLYQSGFNRKKLGIYTETRPLRIFPSVQGTLVSVLYVLTKNYFYTLHSNRYGADWFGVRRRDICSIGSSLLLEKGVVGLGRWLTPLHLLEIDVFGCTIQNFVKGKRLNKEIDGFLEFL